MVPGRCKVHCPQATKPKGFDVARLYEWLIIVAVALSLALPAAAEMMMTKIIEVKQIDSVVELVLDAGMQQGLVPPAQVTLLRSGEAIVHPLNGKVIGVPQEPVGMAQVHQADDHQARAVLLKTYKPPRVGDMVEYRYAGKAPIAVTPPPQAVQENTVGRMMEQMRNLEHRIENNRQMSGQMAPKTVDLKVWDEIHNMKSYLLSLDERLVSLEEHQTKDRQRLNAVMGGVYGEGQMEELTLRYSADTQVRVQVAGKILTLSMEEGVLRLGDQVVEAEPQVEEGAEAMAKEEASWFARLWSEEGSAQDKEGMPEEPLMEEETVVEVAAQQTVLNDKESDVPWYNASWIAPVLALVLAAVGVSIFIEKRMRDKEDGLEDLDLEDSESEFDDGDLIDDGDEDEEDDEEYAGTRATFRR